MDYLEKLLLLLVMVVLLTTTSVSQTSESELEFREVFRNVSHSRIACTELELVYPDGNYSEKSQRVGLLYEDAIKFLQNITGEPKLMSSKIFLSPSQAITQKLILNESAFVVNAASRNIETDAKIVLLNVSNSLGKELISRYTESQFFNTGAGRYISQQLSEKFTGRKKSYNTEDALAELLLSSSKLMRDIKSNHRNSSEEDTPKLTVKKISYTFASDSASFRAFSNLIENISTDEERKIKEVVRLLKVNLADNKKKDANQIEHLFKQQYQIEIFKPQYISNKREIELFDSVLTNETDMQKLSALLYYVQAPENKIILKKILKLFLSNKDVGLFAVTLYERRSSQSLNEAVEEYLTELGSKNLNKKIIINLISNSALKFRKLVGDIRE